MGLGYRTDLAIENKEMYEAEYGSGDIDGIETENIDYDQDIKATRIMIKNELGEKLLGRPQGTYVTLEVKGVIEEKDDIKKRAARALATELREFIKFHYYLKVLVVGLGNDKVTPDSLGPYTASKVKITRQFFIYYEADGDEEMSCVTGFIPGVTGSTGMETAELIQKAAVIGDPETVIVIDSLAARNIDRIDTTIQINDTGISPGGGMGNMRSELSQKTLGKKVVCIGVPTVIDSRTLVMDALADHVKDNKQIESYIKENGRDMIVTSTDIDQVIKDFSDIIAEGINITLHPGIYS